MKQTYSSYRPVAKTTPQLTPKNPDWVPLTLVIISSAHSVTMPHHESRSRFTNVRWLIRMTHPFVSYPVLPCRHNFTLTWPAGVCASIWSWWRHHGAFNRLGATARPNCRRLAQRRRRCGLRCKARYACDNNPLSAQNASIETLRCSANLYNK